MSADAGGVRLYRWGDQWRARPYSDSMPSPVAEAQYVAWPAAQAAAMEAVVEAAKAWAAARNRGAGFWAESDTLANMVDAYAATLPRAPGGEGAGRDEGGR